MSPFWLPPELWRNIFSISTHFTGEFDINDWICRKETETKIPSEIIDLQFARRNLADGNSNRFLFHQNPEFYDQRNLRRTLIVVCKDWYEMCLEYLYGSILIYDASTIRGCISTLKRFEHIAHNVRRLEFNVDNPEGDDEYEITSRRQLLELVKLCPNLLIFHGEVEEAEIHEPISKALAYARLPLRAVLAAHCKKLRHVTGQQVVDRYPASLSFYRHISSFSNLIAIQLPSSIATMAAVERPPITLPSVRVLDLGYQAPSIPPEFGNYLSRWVLPSLEAVHIGTLSHNMALRRFWASHGSKIKTIRIYNRGGVILYISQSVNINFDIAGQSNKLFPNLQQLVVLHNTPIFISSLFFPSISLEIYEVVLHDTWRVNDPSNRYLENQVGYSHIEALLPPHMHMTPNLHTVRISRCPSASDRSERGLRCNALLTRGWPAWEKGLKERDVILEKIYGDE